MNQFRQGSHCGWDGCPRDYQFEAMQRALSGTDRTHEGAIMDYKPDYDTSIDHRTVVERLPTIHRDGIDWSYPFDDPEHWQGLCCGEQGKLDEKKRVLGYLRTCEQPGAFATTYGGWPRIWFKVQKVCMASCWPYWTPRPTVIVNGTFSFGAEWFDWRSLTGAKVEVERVENS